MNHCRICGKAVEDGSRKVCAGQGSCFKELLKRRSRWHTEMRPGGLMTLRLQKLKDLA